MICVSLFKNKKRIRNRKKQKSKDVTVTGTFRRRNIHDKKVLSGPPIDAKSAGNINTASLSIKHDIADVVIFDEMPFGARKQKLGLVFMGNDTRKC